MVVVATGPGVGVDGTGIEISPAADDVERMLSCSLSPSKKPPDLFRRPKMELNPNGLPFPFDGVEGLRPGLWVSEEGEGDCDKYPESLDTSEVALPALSRETCPRSSEFTSSGCKAPVING